MVRMLAFQLLYVLGVLVAMYGAAKMRYVITEHPEVTWFNRKYAREANLTARRYGRGDPFYYVGFHVDVIWPVHNNINVDFYFYELLTNQYKRTFVELHFEVCDLISKDLFFGISFSQFFSHPCPLEPGIYHLENITVPFKNIPEHVPFTKGRVIANFTSKDTQELLGYGHIDMEIKDVITRRSKNKTRSYL